MIVQVQRENLTTKRNHLAATPVNLQRFDVSKWVELSTTENNSMFGFDSSTSSSCGSYHQHDSFSHNHYQNDYPGYSSSFPEETKTNRSAYSYHEEQNFQRRRSTNEKKLIRQNGTRRIICDINIHESSYYGNDHVSSDYDRSSLCSVVEKKLNHNLDQEASHGRQQQNSSVEFSVPGHSRKASNPVQNISVGKIQDRECRLSTEKPLVDLYARYPTSRIDSHSSNNGSHFGKKSRGGFLSTDETANNIRIPTVERLYRSSSRSSCNNNFKYPQEKYIHNQSSKILTDTTVSQTDNNQKNRFHYGHSSKNLQRPNSISKSGSIDRTHSSSSSLSPSSSYSKSDYSSFMNNISRRNSDSSQPSRDWKTAVDPKTGRTYYYDAHTRETQWSKPIELASQEEQNGILEKDKKQREFFANMEANILKCLQTGQLPGSNSSLKKRDEDQYQASLPSKNNNSRQQPQNKLLARPKPISVRTISKMDHELLDELTKVPADSNNKNSNNSRGQVNNDATWFGFQQNKLEQEAIEKIKAAASEMTRASASSSATPPNSTPQKISSSEPIEMTKLQSSQSDTHPLLDKLPSKPNKNLAKPRLMKRNTCGTMYVGSTMSAPDIDATVKCICGLYRAHLLRSAKEEATLGPLTKFPEYEIFNDHISDRQIAESASGYDKRMSGDSLSLYGASFVYGSNDNSCSSLDQGVEILSLDNTIIDVDVESTVPSLDEITYFYRDVLHRSQMENDCMIMSLIYVERLMLMTKGGLSPRRNNWRSLLFSCMVLASKVWDDLSMWNGDFSQTCPAGVSFSLQRINELELAVLSCLKYNVKVLASEYAKYYFLLRSMLIRSGLASTDISSSIPLDSEGAKKFECLSTNFQAIAGKKKIKSAKTMQRSKSAEEQGSSPDRRPNGAYSPRTKKLNLEEVVKM